MKASIYMNNCYDKTKTHDGVWFMIYVNMFMLTYDVLVLGFP
jgi:hypothetical protein